MGRRCLPAASITTMPAHVARTESERRGVGRMFLAGSEVGPVGEIVVIVESAARRLV